MLYLGDCLDILPTITQKIDLVVVDLPYGQTANKWDVCIDLNKMWVELKKICKESCVFVFFTTTKFGVQLINSNPSWFRYDFVWEKSNSIGYLSAKISPLRIHEMIYIFSSPDSYIKDLDTRDYFRKIHKYINKPNKDIRELFKQKGNNHCWYYDSTQFSILPELNYNQLINEYKINDMDGFIEFDKLKKQKQKHKKKYNPQMSIGKPYVTVGGHLDTNYNATNFAVINTGTRYPTSILKYQIDKKIIHSTQKPVLLLEYLIKTYSNEKDIVLDFTMGSGSTGIACRSTKRQFIGIEKDKDIYYSAVNRLW